MSMGKRVAVVAGGRTVEHRLSMESGVSLIRALEGSPFEATLVSIAPDGHLGPLVADLARFDYALPLVHGPALAGLLDALEVPVLGEGETASAAAIDKPLAKRLLCEAGLPVLDSITVPRAHIAARPREVVARIAERIGVPCFVKPANGAASVGASPVHALADLTAALVRAATFDARVIVEPLVDAREIEVGVLDGTASILGELVFRAEFHDHTTKTTPGALELVVPAMVGEGERERLARMAVAACDALEIEAVGRVEFLLDRNTHELFLNEVNPFPSFAPTAVFPRLWEASGLTIPDVVERLAAAADRRARERFRTRRLYESRT